MRQAFALLLLVALATTGCTKSKGSQPEVQPNAAAPVAQAPVDNRPRVGIAKDPVFNIKDEQALDYSDGWKNVLADADAKAAAFTSDEMKAEARSQVVAKADKWKYQDEGRDNIKRLKLAHLQQHPDSAFLVGYYENWAQGQLSVGSGGGAYENEPTPPLVANSTMSSITAKVTPEEMDKAFTVVMHDHNSDYQRWEELEYRNLVTQAAVYDHAESARRAKNDVYYTYIALVAVGDFRSELVDSEGLTDQRLGKQVRKAYLVDPSNNVILVELSAPWGHPSSSAALVPASQTVEEATPKEQGEQ